MDEPNLRSYGRWCLHPGKIAHMFATKSGAEPAAGSSFVEEARHRPAFIHKEPHVSLRFSQCQGTCQPRKCLRHVPVRLMSQRLQHQDFDDASHPFTRFGRLQQAIQQPYGRGKRVLCLTALVAGDEHAGQGDVFKLTQVAERIISGEVVLTRPPHGFSQPALPDPDPGLQRRYGAHIGQRGSDMAMLGRIQQCESALQVSLSLLHPSLGYAQATLPIVEWRSLAQLLAAQQVVCRRFYIAPFQVQFA